MKIIYTSKFVREYKKIPHNVKIIAEEHETLFRKNPYNPKLKTHKLRGKLASFLSFSIGYKYRIICEFDKKNNVTYFHSVGNHDIYQEM